MRRRLKSRRKIAPDMQYQSFKVAKLINYVMEKGHKEIARKIVYGAFADIQKETKKDPLEIFETAVENAGPVMEVRTRRIGGANYQVPHEVLPHRRLNLALRWLVGFAAAKRGKPMRVKLAEEILAASRNEGEAVKRKETIHKMAEANRAFAHFGR